MKVLKSDRLVDFGLASGPGSGLLDLRNLRSKDSLFKRDKGVRDF